MADNDHGTALESPVVGQIAFDDQSESTTRRMTLNMGPQHPSTHGVLRLVLQLDGETITSAKPDIGYLHTGMEKTMQSKTYQQAIVVTGSQSFVTASGWTWPISTKETNCGRKDNSSSTTG